MSYWHRVLLSFFAFVAGGIVGAVVGNEVDQGFAEPASWIGGGICLILAIWFLFARAPEPEVSSFGNPFAALPGPRKQDRYREQIQVCTKCGKVFAARQVSGPEDMISSMEAMGFSKLCPKCGGEVIWR